MTNRQKHKGNRVESQFVKLLLDADIPAQRVLLSGQVGGLFSGDIRIAENYTAEVKARKNGEGFATIQRWLGENDFLFLKQHRKSPIVVMTWEMYLALMIGMHSRSQFFSVISRLRSLCAFLDILLVRESTR